MKKFYIKYKKILIFTVVLALVFSFSVFSVSAFTNETIDDKQYRVLYIPIDKPTVSQNDDVSTAYVEIYYTNMSGSYNVETVVFQYHTVGNTQLIINNDNFYFNITDTGLCSCMWVSSSGGGGSLVRKFYPPESPEGLNNSISFSGYTRILGFRVYGIDAVTDNCIYDYKNWIVNYGSSAITNSNLNTIISQFEQNNDLLNDILEEQQKTNGFFPSLLGLIQDIKNAIVGNEDDAPEENTDFKDSISNTTEKEEQINSVISSNTSQITSFIDETSLTVDSKIGTSILRFFYFTDMFFQNTAYTNLIMFSLRIGIFAFFIGSASIISKAMFGGKK